MWEGEGEGAAVGRRVRRDGQEGMLGGGGGVERVGYAWDGGRAWGEGMGGGDGGRGVLKRVGIALLPLRGAPRSQRSPPS